VALVQEIEVLEILKRAKSGGEVVPWNQDVREEALRRNAKAGYCNRDGSQIISSGRIIMKPATERYRKNYRRIFGHD
jgi:hypothetical protein